MMVERLFLTVARGCLQFVIVVFPDHTQLLFLCNVHLLQQVGLLCQTWKAYNCILFHIRRGPFHVINAVSTIIQ